MLIWRTYLSGLVACGTNLQNRDFSYIPSEVSLGFGISKQNRDGLTLCHSVVLFTISVCASGLFYTVRTRRRWVRWPRRPTITRCAINRKHANQPEDSQHTRKHTPDNIHTHNFQATFWLLLALVSSFPYILSGRSRDNHFMCVSCPMCNKITSPRTTQDEGRRISLDRLFPSC